MGGILEDSITETNVSSTHIGSSLRNEENAYLQKLVNGLRKENKYLKELVFELRIAMNSENENDNQSVSGTQGMPPNPP